MASVGNVIVIGTGPAGISASLYTVRANIKTMVIGEGAGSLDKAEKVENYYGFPEPIKGHELIENGIAQAKRLGVEVVMDEVVGLGYADKFTVKTTSNEYSADCLILTTGTSRQTPNIKGILEHEGHGVSYCAVCDAFFYQGKDVAVFGSGEYALSEAKELLPVVKSVTLITNGIKPVVDFPAEIKVITAPIQEFAGNENLEKIIFKDGSELSVTGVFVAIGMAGSTDLAKKMGVVTNKNAIIVDEHMATNIPGMYAAGDCTGGMIQIAKAVYQGALAGTEAIKLLRKKK